MHFWTGVKEFSINLHFGDFLNFLKSRAEMARRILDHALLDSIREIQYGLNLILNMYM
jgi:hypothetical protein